MVGLTTRGTPETFTRYPVMGSALMHVMIAHNLLHLGQLSVWRRAQGLLSVL